MSAPLTPEDRFAMIEARAAFMRTHVEATKATIFETAWKAARISGTESIARQHREDHEPANGICTCQFPNECLFEAGYKAAPVENVRLREAVRQMVGEADAIATGAPEGEHVTGYQEMAQAIALCGRAALAPGHSTGGEA